MEIKQKITKGLFWSAIDKYSNQLVGIVISMVLARLLSPSEFGIVATASIFMAFLTIFTNVGIAPAIIQRKDLSKEDLNNIFTFTIYLGFVIGGISFISSWWIADFYDNELLEPIVQILSVGLFLSSINIVPSALMSKNFRFKEMATRSLLFHVFFGGLGVVAAYLGAGVYALVCPQIISSIFTFLYNNHFSKVRIRIRMSIEPIKRIFSYSAYVFLSQFINYFSRNTDKIIISKMLSSEALGYYEKSYRLMQMPLNNVSSVIYPVLQPVLSSLQDDMKEMAEKYRRIVKMIASISFPIAVVLFFSAYEIIIVMFGQQWIPSVNAFKILALSIPFTLICNPNGAIFLACNASKRMFIVGVVNTSITIAAFIIGAIWGRTIEAIAWGWSSVELLATSFSYFELYKRVMHQPLLPVIKCLTFPIISAIVLIIIYILYGIVAPDSISNIIQLGIKLLVGSFVILASLRITKQFDIIVFLKKHIIHK